MTPAASGIGAGGGPSAPHRPAADSPRGYLDEDKGQGHIAQEPVVQGWCPGALRPMMSGDGLVVRVRPRGGRLEAAQAAGLADLALRFGSGLIDLSSRANVQLRGVAASGHAGLIAGLAGLGLTDETPAAEAMRNIPVTPFWQAGDGTQEMAAALAAALVASDAPDLPGKFGYALDTGPVPVMRMMPCDIRVERAADGGLIVVPDGSGHGAPAAPADVAAVVMDLARWFVATGGVVGGRGRMARHLAAGATLPARFRAVPAQPAGDGMPRPGLVAAGALVGLAFGQMQADTLAALAALGPLRTTPWRMLLVEGLRAMPDLPGLVTDPADPILQVVACSGAPACVQALRPTRDLARRIAPLAAGAGGVIHVSGCAKGCAHPAPAAITLTATPAGFALIRDGRAADPGPLVAETDIPDLLKKP